MEYSGRFPTSGSYAVSQTYSNCFYGIPIKRDVHGRWSIDFGRTGARIIDRHAGRTILVEEAFGGAMIATAPPVEDRGWIGWSGWSSVKCLVHY